MGWHDLALQSVIAVVQQMPGWGRYLAFWMSPSLNGLAKMSVMVYVL